MKGTTKGRSPQSLEHWRLANAHLMPLPWDALPTDVKEEMYATLLEEQGHVCVYCGATVTTGRGSGHIEHFFPSSKTPTARFDWANLLASCGPRDKKGQPSICGDAKSNWVPVDYVDALSQDCEYHFKYDGMGEIDASVLGGSPAEIMIEKLKLDDKSLVYQRSQIISELEDQIATVNITAVNKMAEISNWRARDNLGRLKSFGHVAARYLEDQAL